MKCHKNAIAPILLAIVLVGCSSAQTPSLAPSPVVDPGVGESVDLASMPSDQTVTRAEMARFFLQAKYGEGYDPLKPVGGFFGDVSGHWAEPWIEQMAVEKISSGYSDGSFRPDSPVTRAEAAVMLLKAKHGSDYFPPQSTGALFNDLAGHWAEAWIEELVAEGISVGEADDAFEPDVPLTAGDLRQMLEGAFGN